MSDRITVQSEDPRSRDAASLMEELSSCLEGITGDSGQGSFNIEDVCVDRALFVVARDQSGNAVGCGAFRPLAKDAAEIKRMYARAKGSGIGALVLAFLESQAQAMGYKTLVLETRLVNQGAVKFYLRSGYRQIPNYGRYVGRADAICFEKKL